MLHYSDGPEAAHHNHADQLQPNVEPLHCGCAEEAAALVELQAAGVFFLEPAEANKISQPFLYINQGQTKMQVKQPGLNCGRYYTSSFCKFLCQQFSSLFGSFIRRHPNTPQSV